MLWLLGIFSIVSLSSAQPLNNPFPWTLDPKTPLDNTILPGQPTKTTAAKGRIAISNGKLVYPDGTRARLYGVTIAGPAVFPDSSQAIAVAARLRSLGINLVRLTHFDYTNYNDASIIIHSSTTSRGFDSTMLRRFDWFIAQLRQQGIYVSLGDQSSTPLLDAMMASLAGIQFATADASTRISSQLTKCSSVILCVTCSAGAISSPAYPTQTTQPLL